jgi:hypothetical protein
LLEVERDPRLANAEQLYQIGHPHGLGFHGGDDPEAGWIRQRLEHPVHPVHSLRWHRHRANISTAVDAFNAKKAVNKW